MDASNISWKPFCWLQVLLVIALLQPIVPAYINGERSLARRNRSANTNPSQNRTENLNSVLDNRTSEYRSRTPQEQRLQQFTEPKNVRESETDDKLDAVIRDLFQIGAGQGVTLFNNPAKPQMVYNPVSDQSSPRDTNGPRCRSALRDGRTFCTEVHNYPQLNQLDPLLKRQFSSFFAEDEAPENISSRFLVPDYEDFCVATERIIYPKAGETKDANWLFILNDNQNFRQGVRVEECRNANTACKFTDFFPNGYMATCKQNYIYRTLIAITPNGTLTQDNFKLPSCCKCVLRQV